MFHQSLIETIENYYKNIEIDLLKQINLEKWEATKMDIFWKGNDYIKNNLLLFF